MPRAPQELQVKYLPLCTIDLHLTHSLLLVEQLSQAAMLKMTGQLQSRHFSNQVELYLQEKPVPREQQAPQVKAPTVCGKSA